MPKKAKTYLRKFQCPSCHTCFTKKVSLSLHLHHLSSCQRKQLLIQNQKYSFVKRVTDGIPHNKSIVLLQEVPPGDDNTWDRDGLGGNENNDVNVDTVDIDAEESQPFETNQSRVPSVPFERVTNFQDLH